MEPSPQESAQPAGPPAEVETPDRGASVEIHPPHTPISSLRDFLLQLMTITAGVLIALSLEGLVEWNHYRVLVREARATISQEITDNKKEVESVLAQSEARKENFDAALRLVTDRSADQEKDRQKINIGFLIAELSEASWETAGSTGTLSHMDYSEVRKYSRLYGIQHVYAEQQRRALERMTAAMAVFGEGQELTPAGTADAEAFRQQVLALRAELLIEEQLGRQLAEVYRTALEE